MPKQQAHKGTVVSGSQGKEKEAETLCDNSEIGELHTAQRKDTTLHPCYRKLQRNAEPPERGQYFLKNQLLYRRAGRGDNLHEQWVVPETHRPHILQSGHIIDENRHMGVRETLQQISGHYCWPGMTGDVRRWVKSCSECQRAPPNKRIKRKLALKVEDKVEVWSPAETNILQVGWKGPYPVEKVVSKNIYKIRIGEEKKNLPRHLIRKYEERSGSKASHFMVMAAIRTTVTSPDEDQRSPVQHRRAYGTVRDRSDLPNDRRREITSQGKDKSESFTGNQVQKGWVTSGKARITQDSNQRLADQIQHRPRWSWKQKPRRFGKDDSVRRGRGGTSPEEKPGETKRTWKQCYNQDGTIRLYCEPSLTQVESRSTERTGARSQH